MNRFLRGENGGLLTDIRELSSPTNNVLGADTQTSVPSVKPRGAFLASESRKHALKRDRTCRDSEAADSSPLVASCGAIDADEICVGLVRQRPEAQGRPDGVGEGLEMISTTGQAIRDTTTTSNNNNNSSGTVIDVTTASSSSSSCAKGKEERKGKNVMRGWKRERDAAPAHPAPIRTRKEKHGDSCSAPVFAPSALPEHLCRDIPGHCVPDPRTVGENKNGLDDGIKGGSAIVVRRYDDTAVSSTSAVKKHRGAEKLDPMFTVPAPPVPVVPGPLGGSLPSAPSFPPPSLPPTSPKRAAVRTRSVGTSTLLDGSESPESDAARLGPCQGPHQGPCQPGTSVNLEGIVWHETEEGVLVVNVTWRKRTYVGTLLDCTKHDWAPPRFCESPSSDPEMPGGRGRGKRMKLAVAERPCVDPLPASKVRGLSQHRSRGGGVTGSAGPIHSKGRRGSLNLINSNCRTSPSFFTVEEVKPANSSAPLSGSGKRKTKPPADLDLSMVSSDDGKHGNGKRIRAKSRSAPSTPQGKSDPSFMNTGGGCSSSPPPPPILIDCPHPNCTKRYKHINGLRYHQTHAHLEVEGQRKPELETSKDIESEERLSDCEDTMGSLTYDLSEANSNSANSNGTNGSSASSSKKAAPLYKVTTVGSPKNRRLLLSTDHSPTAKTRRASLLRDLPIISNMTVVLENCMVPDRSSTVEMPKLEAEGLIDKKGAGCDKGKKTNGKVEKLSKSRANRPIAPAPAPPKLIAIPNTVYNTSTGSSPAECTTTNHHHQHHHQQQQLPPPQQPSPMAAVGLSCKNLPLKPIKPKLSVVVEPSLVKPTLVTCSKETRKKEKRRLKDKHNKDTLSRTSNGDCGVKMEDGSGGPKMAARDAPGSLLKEHLSKQEVLNGITGSQESRMASIRAEADKVYTFTDNAPSPSIGASSRLDAPGSAMTTPDGGSKNNSPAYSDISDAGDEGGASECRPDGPRSKMSSSEGTPNSNHGNPSNSNHGNPSKTPPSAPTPLSKDPQSPYYHGYESYYLHGYMQTDRQNHCGTAFQKGVAHDNKGKDRKEEIKDEDKGSSHEFPDSKKADGSAQSQLQLAMSQTQTALAQSLYYGQYARGLYMDQKLLMGNKSCEQPFGIKQRAERGQGGPGRDSEEGGSVGGAILAKGADGCCSKPMLSYAEMGERGERGQQLSSMLDHQQTSDVKSSSSSSSSSLHNPNSQTDLDSNVSYSSPSDGLAWAHRRPHSKYSQQSLGHHGDQADEIDEDRAKEWRAIPEPTGAKMAACGGGERPGGETKNSRAHGSQHVPPTAETEEADGLEEADEKGQEPIGGLSEESHCARVAVSPPMTPQQPYIQYQHPSYPPYLAMCERSRGSSRGVSPTVVHNYPGFHYPLYGKTAGREEAEGTKSSTEAPTVDLLHQPALHSHGKSPAPGERGSPEGERESERERNHLSFARHLHTHHHTHLGMSYNLMSGQYDIYQGLSSRSLVTNQQVTGHSSNENEGKN